jgi:mannose-6-phosphate isomerase
MADLPLYPLLFEPFLRPMPWGGKRLAGWVQVPFPANERIGEAWLLSDHKLHTSRIMNGPLAGGTLHELMTKRSVDLLGYQAERFPLLIKLLDAHENLSVQVHPDDEAARAWAPGEGGKTEAWVVLSAEPDAALYLGLRRAVDKATLLRELATGNVPLCLQRFQPKAGECYFVPAGTIHALGGGLVILEVQQTSDATFRLYDWGRVDASGKPRPLHIEAGMACLKDAGDTKNLRHVPQPSSGDEILTTCGYFCLRRRRFEQASRLVGPAIFFILDGEARVRYPDEESALRSGLVLLVPAKGDLARLEPRDVVTAVEIGIPAGLRNPAA